MRVALIAVLVIASASIARAEPPGLVIPTPAYETAEPMIVFVDAPAEESSYRWQVIASDAVAVTAAVFALRKESEDLATVGLVAYGLGAPMVHAGNGHGRRALGSLALRVGLPLLGGYLGAKLSPPPVCAQGADLGGDCTSGDTIAKGIVVGAIAAMAIDAWVVAKPERKPSRTWSPNAAATSGGVSVGVSGSF